MSKFKIVSVLLLTSGVLLLGSLVCSPVWAQEGVVIRGEDLDDTGLLGGRLQDIIFPTFLSLDAIENFSVFSYVALGIQLIFVVLALIWVVMVLRAAVQVIQGKGEADAYQGAQKKLGAVFWSITFLFGFFVILSILAGLFGLGSFWQWPRYFSRCSDGRYYFNVAQQYAGTDGVQATVDQVCFGGATGF